MGPGTPGAKVSITSLMLELYREPSDAHRTFGRLFADDAYVCETMENGVRADKIPGEAAMPAGVYEVTLENSPRFGPGTLTINGVPWFGRTRVHKGSDEGDTRGCVLVGEVRNAGSISRCESALTALKAKVQTASIAGEVWLHIQDAAEQE